VTQNSRYRFTCLAGLAVLVLLWQPSSAASACGGPAGGGGGVGHVGTLPVGSTSVIRVNYVSGDIGASNVQVRDNRGTLFNLDFSCTGGLKTTEFFYTADQDSGELTYSYSVSLASSVGVARAKTVSSPKNLGLPDPNCPAACEGNPINVGTGNKFQVERDYDAGAATELSLVRYYNSGAIDATGFGANWRSNYDRSLLNFVSSSVAQLTRADGRLDTFRLKSGQWQSDPDVTTVLAAVSDAGGVPTGWTLTREDDQVETYGLDGKLVSIATRAGRVTRLSYGGDGRLATVVDPFGRTLAFSYTPAGQVDHVTAPDGGIYSYAYDPSNNLISATYPDGSTRRYLYQNAAFPHALTGIVDENGVQFASYAYDSQGRAVSTEHAGGVGRIAVAYYGDGSSTITDALGRSRIYRFQTQYGMLKPIAVDGPCTDCDAKSYGYDAAGFLASKMDRNGNLTAFARDPRGLETSRIEAVGTAHARTIGTTWHPKFHLPAAINEPGRTTTFTYDGSGDLLKEKITAGGQTRARSYTYNAIGQVLTIDGPRTDIADVSRLTYDGQGNLASVADPVGRLTRFTSYDANGRLLSMTDANGLVTTFAYDPRGRMARRVSGDEITSYTYDKAGSLITVVHPDGSAETYAYDAARRLNGITAALGDGIALTLDAMSNPTREQHFDPLHVLRWDQQRTYDTADRPSSDVGSSGQTTAYAHDANGNLTGVTDPLGRATTYEFDPLDRLVRSVDANGGEAEFAFDALDQLTGVTDPRGLVTRIGYDTLGNPTSTASPDAGVVTRTFDSAGNVKTSTDARGIKTTNTYDALNRLTRSATSDGTVTTYRYDEGANGVGHVTSMIYTGGTTSWSYDVHGRVTEKRQTGGTATLVIAYGYDVAGRLATTTYPSGRTLTYIYDGAGRVSGINVGGALLVTNVTYEPFGPVSGWTAGNGAVYHRSHDADGAVSSIGWTTANGTSRSISFGDDAAKQITALADSALPAATFGYDNLGQLDQFLRGTENQTLAYDDAGNRLSKTVDSATTTYVIDGASNRMLGAGATGFAYDANGNLKGDGIRAFTYDGRNRLTKVVGAGTTDYWVNGLGQRVSKRGTGALPGGRNWFAYDEGGHLIGEYTAAVDATTATPVTEHVYLGDLPVAVLKPGAIYYTYPDQLGAPWTVANASGATVWNWKHDPFGVGAATGTLANYNLRFPGQYYDKETSLHYNYFRDYDPKLGRYVQSDPIGLAGGVNTYAYVGSNTSNHVDPYGLVDLNLLPQTSWWGPTRDLYKTADAFNPLGAYSVAAHGAPSEFIFNGEPDTTNVKSANWLANRIREIGKWKAGQPIVLFSCNTGSGGEKSFAQLLANALGVPVVAPNASIYTLFVWPQTGYRLANNRFDFLFSPAPQGQWLSFYPNSRNTQ